MDPAAFTDLVRTVAADEPPVTVTLVLPVDGASPDRGPDGILARRLARTAVAALTAGGDGLPDVDRDAMSELADRLDEVADEIGQRLDRSVRGEGLACVVTPTTARIVGLTRTPRERVVVEAAPTLIDPLLDAVTADPEVDVLVVSTGGGATAGTRLLRLSDHQLDEPAGTGFPMTHDVRDHGEPRKEEPPDDRIRDAYVDDFLRRVDAALVALPEAGRERPLVVVGTAELRDRFAAVRSGVVDRRVVADVDGNHDRLLDSQLAAAVRDALEAARRDRAIAAVADLEELPPTRRAGGTDVDALAAEGRVHRLLVEDGAADETLVDGVVVTGRIARAVRAAHDTGAEVVVVPPGALGERGGIVAVLRW
jgi:hypothetical protein